MHIKFMHYFDGDGSACDQKFEIEISCRLLGGYVENERLDLDCLR